MQRKLFPLLIFGFVFFGVLSFQIGSDLWSPSANIIKIKDAKRKQLESLFSTLEVKYTTGEKVKLKDLKEDLVLVNFWASWCTPCIAEFKGIANLEKVLGKDKINVVGINCDTEDPSKNVKMVEKKHALTFKSALDPDNKILDMFGIVHLPANIIYHKGKVIYFSEKFTDYTDPSMITKLKKFTK